MSQLVFGDAFHHVSLSTVAAAYVMPATASPYLPTRVLCDVRYSHCPALASYACAMPCPLLSYASEQCRGVRCTVRRERTRVTWGAVCGHVSGTEIAHGCQAQRRGRKS
eukprot:2562215-Rhodomonas_salina.1